MGKSKRNVLRITAIVATGSCLLALMAGCGQAATNASANGQSKTSQTPQSQSSSNKADLSSASGNPTSAHSTSASKGGASTGEAQQSAPSATGSSKASQTESSAPDLQASNEAITLMAYVKAMGGLENVPASRLIVNSNLLSLETASGEGGAMKLITVSGDQVMVTDEVFGPPSSTPAKTATYNVGDLLNEYYQTAGQQAEINNLLAQGTRHNVIDFLAYMQVWGKTGDFTGQNVEIMGNVVSGGTADSTGTITLNGNEVTMTNSQPNCGGSQGCQPSTNHTWNFSAGELLGKYYSAASQKQIINNYIDQANQTQSQWLPSAGQIQN
ncbi:MAG: hypothetical protein IKT06_02055 [Aeriscardovia sp.]|nr:hypothetical protein [Aeriscardovia sp.]